MRVGWIVAEHDKISEVGDGMICRLNVGRFVISPRRQGQNLEDFLAAEGMTKGMSGTAAEGMTEGIKNRAEGITEGIAEGIRESCDGVRNPLNPVLADRTWAAGNASDRLDL